MNPTVGDIEANFAQILDICHSAQDQADLIVFPELVTCGYPPEDLILKPSFLDKIEEQIDKFLGDTKHIDSYILLPSPFRCSGSLFNAAHVIHKGEIITTDYKWHLPNYGVFDEKRLFAEGTKAAPFTINGITCGILICEDMWLADKTEALKKQGADILIVPNASPYEYDKHGQRLGHASARTQETGCPVLYANQWGGQDELVFDGLSFVSDASGNLTHKAPAFSDAIITTSWSKGYKGLVCDTPVNITPKDDTETLYRALVTGLRDYVTKNKFPGVLIGLSGGIDSALSAVIAVDALGADNVHCVMMPSQYTSDNSLNDAKALAEALGVKYDILEIGSIIESIEKGLTPLLPDDAPETTFENIQSRARGLLLMGLSNANGKMVLSTGNKSEMAVGYATLYGDMCGGFNALKDLYKMQVFALSRWRNENMPAGCYGPEGAIMPGNIITKPPTAELRDKQTDQDSLPPYEELDALLMAMIEDDKGLQNLIDEGHSPENIDKVWRLLHLAEYKRRQAPPGVKITSRSFGRDRRYPITNGYRH